jgi:hypothetical protein
MQEFVIPYIDAHVGNPFAAGGSKEYQIAF